VQDVGFAAFVKLPVVSVGSQVQGFVKHFAAFHKNSLSNPILYAEKQKATSAFLQLWLEFVAKIQHLWSTSWKRPVRTNILFSGCTPIVVAV
jgi:hypothetical protein